MSRVLIAIAVVSLVLPATASAIHEPGNSSSPQTSSITTYNPLRDGKYLPEPVRAVQQPAQVVQVIKPGGFDFRDAGIGAAVGALVLAVLGGSVLVALRDRGTSHLATTKGG
jgi:hypothetical protein